MADKGITYEEDAQENHIPSDDELRLVSKLCALRVSLQKHLDTYKGEVKRLQDEINRLDRGDIPDAMRQAGLQEFTLSSGEQVKIKDDVAVSVAEKNKPLAHAWIRNHGGAPIIKSKYEFVFGKDENDKAELLEKSIPPNLAPYTKKTEAIHAQTLKRFVKDILERDGDIDEEGRKYLGVFEYKVADIKM